MLRIRILAVGRCKERFYAETCREYEKRLSRFAKLEIIEIPDERAPDSLSPAQIEQVKEAEGIRLLNRLAPEEHVIALNLDGAQYGSEAWAKHWQECMNLGKSRFAFVIGGSHGLSQQVLSQCQEKLCFSQFTFCHQLMRVILLEQIYRSMKINAGESYHK